MLNTHRIFAVALLILMPVFFVWGCEKSKIEKEIGNLHSTDREVRETAVNALIKIGEPAVVHLIKALDEENLAVRVAAAKALGEIGDGRAVIPLIDTIKASFDLDLMFEVALALSAIGDDRACEMLLKEKDKANPLFSKIVLKTLIEAGLCDKK